jgi:hypothetical protein
MAGVDGGRFMSGTTRRVHKATPQCTDAAAAACENGGVLR